jgi:hypothetical protein
MRLHPLIRSGFWLALVVIVAIGFFGVNFTDLARAVEGRPPADSRVALMVPSGFDSDGGCRGGMSWIDPDDHNTYCGKLVWLAPMDIFFRPITNRLDALQVQVITKLDQLAAGQQSASTPEALQIQLKALQQRVADLEKALAIK